MTYKKLIDYLASNTIIYISYILIISLWYICYINLQFGEKLILIYLPYGITVLSFLFFNIKIIFGLIFSIISFYLILKKYGLVLPLEHYFVLSSCQLISVPIALLVLQRLNISVGIGKNYKLDKTNIYHILLITIFSTIILGILVIFSSIFYEQQTNMLIFVAGNFFGGTILIILIKLLVNLPIYLKIY